MDWPEPLDAGRAQHVATCKHCHHWVTHASNLRGKRLGSHERMLLLFASSPEEGGRAIPAVRHHNAQTAIRRAISTLRNAGLMVTGPYKRTYDPGILQAAPGPGGRKWLRLRVAKRSPLGEQVVKHYGKELKAGKPIRWVKHTQAIRQDIVDTCPQQQQDQQG